MSTLIFLGFFFKIFTVILFLGLGMCIVAFFNLLSIVLEIASPKYHPNIIVNIKVNIKDLKSLNIFILLL